VFVENYVTRAGAALNSASGVLTLSDSRIINNAASTNVSHGAWAGAVAINGGSATITGTVIENNSGLYAAGLYSSGTTSVSQSILVGNAATIQGGGIENWGVMTLSSSLIARNDAEFHGGVWNNATLDMVNCTVAENETWFYDGGGVTSGRTATTRIIASTIASNRASRWGGGIYVEPGSQVRIVDSLVAGNRAASASGSGPDVRGTVVSEGHNLIGNGAGSSGFGAAGDLVGTAAAPIEARLGPLQDNGGPTWTMALLAGSPAIDAGVAVAGVTTDQRGVARPQGAAYDIGAYELVQVVNAPPVLVAIGSTAEVIGGAREGRAMTLVGTFTDDGPVGGQVVVVHWGDGQTTTAPVGAGSFSTDHVYKDGGVYTVKVSVVDALGAASNELRTTAYVTGAGLRGGVMWIVGTEAADSVYVVADAAGGHEVRAPFLSGRKVFSRNAGSIRVLLGGGDDVLTVDASVTVPVLARGGAGDDELRGGSGRDVLLGEEGDDRLHGGAGVDLLVGGVGADLLRGQGGDDLLAAGTTSRDADDAALLAVLAEWEARRDPAVTGLKLNDRTVYDDTSRDDLAGGSGADWYFWYPTRDAGIVVPGQDRETVTWRPRR
jgi:hypothetical protein